MWVAASAVGVYVTVTVVVASRGVALVEETEKFVALAPERVKVQSPVRHVLVSLTVLLTAVSVAEENSSDSLFTVAAAEGRV